MVRDVISHQGDRFIHAGEPVSVPDAKRRLVQFHPLSARDVFS